MTVLTAWVLMTYFHTYAGVQYSPPVADEVSCEALKKVYFETVREQWDQYKPSARCIRVTVFK